MKHKINFSTKAKNQRFLVALFKLSEVFSVPSEAKRGTGMLDINPLRFSSVPSEAKRGTGMLDIKPVGGFK